MPVPSLVPSLVPSSPRLPRRARQVARLAPRLAALVAALAIGTTAASAQDGSAAAPPVPAGQPRLPFGFPTRVRVVTATPTSASWRLQRRDYTLAPADTAIPNPPLGGPGLPIDGAIVGPVTADSLAVSTWVAGDAARSSAAGRTWVATIPWDAVLRVEREVENTPVIERHAWRKAIGGSILGALLGGVVARDSRVGGAVLGGAIAGWGSWVIAAQGASVWAPRCWRLVYERETAVARVRAGERPWFAPEREPTCDAPAATRRR